MKSLGYEELERIRSERVSKLVSRAEEVREAEKRRKLVGSVCLIVAVFLLLISWVIVGIGMLYAILGAIGSFFMGIGFYLLLTEPKFRPCSTLIDEIQMILLKHGDDWVKVRDETEEAVEEHKDEAFLASRVHSILSTNEGKGLIEALKNLVQEVRGAG